MRSPMLPGIALVLFATACGGKSEPATETTAPVAEAPEPAPVEKPAPAPEAMAFKDMNHEQRIAFMKQTVLPAMKTTFQEFDSKKFAEFNCKTCHGAGAADGTFKMPNPGLPVLPSMDKFMAFAKDPKHEPWVKFMAEKVKPQMAKLLQKSEFDPQTNTGEFGCTACHNMEGGGHDAGKRAN